MWPPVTWCLHRRHLLRTCYAIVIIIIIINIIRPSLLLLLLKMQHFLSLLFWRKIVVFEDPQGPIFKSLSLSVSSVAYRQYLRSASRGLLVVPRHRLSSYGRRAFSMAGPAIWNRLSSDSLRDPAISRDSFKRSLKTFLFSAYSCT